MKLIGIRGHRGAGKNTITYLLAKTMDYLMLHEDDFVFDDFENEYNLWCKEIKDDESRIHRMDCNRVIVEGFGDGPKMMLSMLVGIDMKNMNDDYMKDHIIINLKDFSYDIYSNENIPTTITADEYSKAIMLLPTHTVKNDTYMSLRELVLFFGLYVMQKSFGQNVWVKSMAANALFYNGLYPDDSDDFKIFSDVKSSSEVTYIKERDGVIIEVERPGHVKQGGLDLLRNDNRYDYKVIIDNYLENTISQVLRIAREITFFQS